MRSCRLTIYTSVDGQETEFSCLGKLCLNGREATVQYHQENANVTLRFYKGGVEIERAGDYTLFLSLREGESIQGKIGIGGNEGELTTKADQVRYSVTADSLMAMLRYDLLTAGDPQKMKLRILARLE